MNPACIPKDVLLADWAHRDIQVTKGRSCKLVEVTAFRIRPFLSTGLSNIQARIIQFKALVAIGAYSWLSCILKTSQRNFIFKEEIQTATKGATRENKVNKEVHIRRFFLFFFSFRHLFCLKINISRRYFPNAPHDEIGRATGWRGVLGKKTRRISEWHVGDTKGVDQCNLFLCSKYTYRL